MTMSLDVKPVMRWLLLCSVRLAYIFGVNRAQVFERSLRRHEWFRKLIGGWWEVRFSYAQEEWWWYPSWDADKVYSTWMSVDDSIEAKRRKRDREFSLHFDAARSKARDFVAACVFEGRTAAEVWSFAEFGPPWCVLLQVNYSTPKRTIALEAHPYRGEP